MRILFQIDEQYNDGARDKAHESYHPLDHVREFRKAWAFDNTTWTIEAHTAFDNIELARGVGEAAAAEAMDTLLRLIGDRGEGTAIIAWNGKQFTNRTL